MATSQRKPSQPKIQLAPNQIYIKRPGMHNPVQTLIEGTSPDWSYYRWEILCEISLYYKGYYITNLIPAEPGKWVDEQVRKPRPYGRKDLPAFYSSLADAVHVYEQDAKRLALLDKINKDDGLEEWCVRQSFTPSKLPIKLEFPPDERRRLERLASFDGHSLEIFALEALYKHLSAVEDRYTAHEEWIQRQQAITPTSNPQQEALA